MSPNVSIEQEYHGIVIGVDEAGRGPLAGPVVAAAVVLPKSIPEGINDSKKLTAKKRAHLYDALMETAIVGVGIATVAEIDEHNILNATYLAMRRAVKQVIEQTGVAEVALIDGNKIPPKMPCPCVCVVKGDSKSLSIAAASIIAKVTRDNIMAELGTAHPLYNWTKNAGYGTKEHRAAIADHGVTEHHRRSFSPIKEIVMERLL